MVYNSNFTGSQVDLSVGEKVKTQSNEPTLFTGITTSNNPSPQVLTAGVWKDVEFVDALFLAQGDFSYINDKIVYTGVKDKTIELNITCNLACNTINSVVTLSQWINGIEDTASSNTSKSESNTSRVPFAISNKFDLTNGDEINLRILSSLNSTVNMYNFSVTLETLEIID